MFAGLQCGDGQFCMGTVGSGNRNDVHGRVGEDALRVGGGEFCTVLLLQLFSHAGLNIAEAAHAYALGCGCPAGMCPARAATTNKRPSQGPLRAVHSHQFTSKSLDSMLCRRIPVEGSNAGGLAFYRFFLGQSQEPASPPSLYCTRKPHLPELSSVRSRGRPERHEEIQGARSREK